MQGMWFHANFASRWFADVLLQEAVPLEELWGSIERHAEARQAVAATDTALSERAQQYRALQKRLLLRLKDRQPGSVAHLDLLLEETFHQLLDLGVLSSDFLCSCIRFGSELS